MAKARLLANAVYFIISILVTWVRSQSSCSDPAGVANAEILTSSPYAHLSLVTYRCYSRFTMSGSPSQECNNGVWQGTAPTCSFISLADLHEQTVDFEDQSGDTMMVAMVVLIGLVFLVVVILMILALCYICKRCRSRTPTRKPKKVTIKNPSPESARSPRMVSLVDRVMADRQPKELSGWRPFAKPMRENNTSTQ